MDGALRDRSVERMAVIGVDGARWGVLVAIVVDDEVDDERGEA